MKNANPLSPAGLLACAALALAGCGAGRPAPAPPPSAPKTVADYFPIRVGPRIVRMQLAVLEPEMEHGLMGRRDLAPDEGMIFVYRAPTQMNFWMHDTPTPLDIGYFAADGTLAEVYPLLPFDERTVSSRRMDLQFALEMNQGWYAAHGVRPGMKLDRTALAAALRARGFDPKDFGLGAP